MEKISSSISILNEVAMGDSKADLILHNCSLVSVYTNEILTQIQIAIVNERIAYVGPDASHCKGPKTVLMNLEGKYVTPGFADPHIHIDQFVLPSELAKKSLLCGVTSLFSDVFQKPQDLAKHLKCDVKVIYTVLRRVKRKLCNYNDSPVFDEDLKNLELRATSKNFNNVVMEKE